MNENVPDTYDGCKQPVMHLCGTDGERNPVTEIHQNLDQKRREAERTHWAQNELNVTMHDGDVMGARLALNGVQPTTVRSVDIHLDATGDVEATLHTGICNLDLTRIRTSLSGFEIPSAALMMMGLGKTVTDARDGKPGKPVNAEYFRENFPELLENVERLLNASGYATIDEQSA